MAKPELITEHLLLKGKIKTKININRKKYASAVDKYIKETNPIYSKLLSLSKQLILDFD
jgi:hypothetical protein